ncbi:sulfurtransferase complex subunit TusC [Candidatus Pantoea carbekii]|uniref:Uncharacterized protein n=1 Tax=Candidatus Pantoea carbekii TaxID=1235990 RepID=U3U928_9GAMM|nr:sulfurtransferase complex subunit TusC [Candidatus Pantoea carbekii]AKC32465.1 DsrE_DsrF-like sulfur reduction protein [Candidatus Pantoea carbekii]BAO00193.1 hypothetical protein HHS_02230 [Candidatus Pantoea carbekii]
MKPHVAFLFTKAPHGSSVGREGLDAALATAIFSQKIGIFFISDGVLQLTCNQQPNQILSRNYISTFNVLELYDINEYFVCEMSLRVRGQSLTAKRILPIKILKPVALRKKLTTYHRIFRF